MADTNLLVLAKEFSKLRSDVKEVLKMPVGPEGKQGEQGLPGKDGKDGLNGRDGIGIQGPPGAPGRDGRDGKDGKDGIDGQDGVSVTNAYIDFDGSLVIELSDGNQIDAGFVSVESRDNIVQQLKNGALSLNELLPSQTGNANKYLKTDGENTSWDTLTGSDIDLSSPGPIGSTTPAAATFTTLTATSASLQAAGAQAGLTMLRNTDTSSSSTRIYLDSSVGVSSIYNGGNNVRFQTNATIGTSSGSTQFQISTSSAAVNYVQVTGGATGGQPYITSQGSDSSIGLNIASKGTSFIYLRNAGTTVQFSAGGTSTAVNYLNARGNAAGTGPQLEAVGSDTNIDLALTPKGTGLIRFGTYTAGAPTATGYISIKAANGTTYKVLVGT